MTHTPATGSAEMTVTPADASDVVGSGELPVLATPRLAALMERAALATLHGRLEPGQTTVGVRLDIHHTRATPVGARVEATARLLRRKGRMLVLALTASDEAGVVGKAEHHRLVVDRETFMANVRPSAPE